jgi:hypothetical protein
MKKEKSAFELVTVESNNVLTEPERGTPQVPKPTIGPHIMLCIQCYTPFSLRRIFPVTPVSGPVLDSTQPPIEWVPGALSLGVKRVGRKADHSPPTSAEVRNS